MVRYTAVELGSTCPSSEVHQAAVRINALAVPAQQCRNRKRMTKIVKSRW